MPFTTGDYSNNEVIIFNKLRESGLNTAASCGILANLYKESGFKSDNVQNSYESSVGDDKSYTKKVDNGSYSRNKFSRDKAGYGIAQWTYWSRKEGLYDFKGSQSIGDLSMQISYLIHELSNSYSTLLYDLMSLEDTREEAYRAGYIFHRDFERSAGGENASHERGNLAIDFYSYYSGNPADANTSVPNLGQKIVLVARSMIKDNEGKSPSKNSEWLIHSSYDTAGVEIIDEDIEGIYQEYKSTKKSVKSGEVAAADLLFYENDSSSSGLDHIALANGVGGRIHIIKSGSSYLIEEETGLGNPTYILRILADSQTSQGAISEDLELDGTIPGLSPDLYAAYTSTDPHNLTVLDNLELAEAEGFDYGYLIDMNHPDSDVFRFYVPEFSEQAGAQWSAIEIRGRSVDVMSYERTSSRVINISLELYAGVGMYKAKSGESGLDTVSRLHRDANFLKSLEYPDYTQAIVRPPAEVNLILGSAVNIVGVVSNVVVEHLKPVDEQNRAMYLKVSFTVTQTAKNPIDYTDVRNGIYTLVGDANIDSMLLTTPPKTTEIPQTSSDNVPEEEVEQVDEKIDILISSYKSILDDVSDVAYRVEFLVEREGGIITLLGGGDGYDGYFGDTEARAWMDIDLDLNSVTRIHSEIIEELSKEFEYIEDVELQKDEIVRLVGIIEGVVSNTQILVDALIHAKTYFLVPTDEADYLIKEFNILAGKMKVVSAKNESLKGG